MVAEALTPTMANPPLRLPKLAASHVALSNHLLSKVAHSPLQIDQHLYDWHWHLADNGPIACPVVTTEIRLDSTDHACWLTLHQESAGVIDTDIDLASVHSDLRHVAAALRYSRLINHLEGLTGRHWHVAAVSGSTAPAAARRPHTNEWLRCAFSVHNTRSDTRCTKGHLDIEPGSWANWSRAPVLRPVQSARNGPMPMVPVALTVVLAGQLALTPSAWRSLQRGTAIVLNRAAYREIPCWLYLPDRTGYFHVVLQGNQIELKSELKRGALPQTDDYRSEPMNQALPDMAIDSDNQPAPDTRTDTDVDIDDNNYPTANHVPADDGDRTQTSTILGSVPILLEFQIGTLTLPFNELENTLVAGYVFTLNQELGPQTVTLRANGMPVARGELIHVGDVLAVRINEVVPHGPV